ncbi:MAG: hypothetical protein PUH39_05460 [Bacteroidales bacterium]|nr:hypothetical protein [Bacteroidales bacterium]
MRRFLVLHSSLQNHSFVKREYDGLLNILASDFDAQFDFLDNLESLPSSSKYEDFIISTGGVENIFLDLLKRNLVGTNVTLIADGRFNSLAASMEILTYLNYNNIKAFIAYGSNEEISARLKEHPHVDFVNEQCGSAALSLSGDKIAVFGEPSDWLIASNVDRDFLKQKFNIDFVDIPLETLFRRFSLIDDNMVEFLTADFQAVTSRGETTERDLLDSLKIYLAINQICQENNCTCATVRCFSIIEKLKATGCLALALLNDEGIDAACEGDLQSLLSMILVRRVTGMPSFMANPSAMSKDNHTTTFAHCTVPTTMCRRYGFRSHFESKCGLAVAGEFSPSEVYTIFKWGGEKLDRFFVEEAVSVVAPSNENLCRSQLTLNFYNPEYMLNNPIGNHHIIVKGAFADKLRTALKR